MDGIAKLACRAVGALALAAAAAMLIPPGDARAQADTLRVIAHADLRNIDPIWTTAGITLAHGYMIYDKLYEFDAEGVAQPQMAEGHTLSEDGLVYTITLRDGLLFHDGAPVTATDVVRSLERWRQRDPVRGRPGPDDPVPVAAGEEPAAGRRARDVRACDRAHL